MKKKKRISEKKQNLMVHSVGSIWAGSSIQKASEYIYIYIYRHIPSSVASTKEYEVDKFNMQIHVQEKIRD